jgi:hypothetical protein
LPTKNPTACAARHHQLVGRLGGGQLERSPTPATLGTPRRVPHSGEPGCRAGGVQMEPRSRAVARRNDLDADDRQPPSGGEEGAEARLLKPAQLRNARTPAQPPMGLSQEAVCAATTSRIRRPFYGTLSDADLARSPLTPHPPPLALARPPQSACDDSDRRQLRRTYPLELQIFHVQHTPCTVGSSSGRPDRPGGMYPFGWM